MTDKEIEKALEICSNATTKFPIARSCLGCPYEFEHCDQKNRDALAYINRLKAEIERLKRSDQSKENCTIEQHAEVHRLRDEIKQIRKDTAKEILQHLFNFAHSGTKGNSNVFVHACNEMKYKIRVEAKKYGVEIDE